MPDSPNVTKPAGCAATTSGKHFVKWTAKGEGRRGTCAYCDQTLTETARRKKTELPVLGIATQVP